MKCIIINDDSLNVMIKLTADSIHSCVTDPPYGLSFMGKEWDRGIPPLEYWKEVYRILKPGGYLLAFGGSRTYHRLACLIEDAGFEIRDTIMWIYSSGFPKGLNIGKATELDEWEGWNTNLKPAHEPIIMARKPLDGKIVDNVIKHGTGGINIDECRIDLQGDKTSRTLSKPTGWKCTSEQVGTINDDWQKGRYPANVIHDGNVEFPDNAARFFYCSKASKKDRDEGLAANNHPTVKPNSLMRYLCKLVTPKNGIVLDPFMGSGSTGKAAVQEGFNFIGIELNKEYCDIAKSRIEHAICRKKEDTVCACPCVSCEKGNCALCSCDNCACAGCSCKK